MERVEKESKKEGKNRQRQPLWIEISGDVQGLQFSSDELELPELLGLEFHFIKFFGNNSYSK